MRISTTRHPSDDELIRALDGELPPRHVVPLADHLAACAGCRARMDQIETTASNFVHAYRVFGPDESPRPLFSRTRLAARMAELSRKDPAWPVPSMPLVLGVTRVRAMLAVTAVAVLVAVGSWRLSVGSDAVGGGYQSREAGALPIAALTPGAAGTARTSALCGGAASEDLPPIDDAVRAEVVRTYGMDRVPVEEYELDFLITPGLGGTADARNLWPERYGSRVWNARVKDQLEERLRQLVCSGAVDLATAQRDLATDWIAAYRKYFGVDRPPRIS